MLVSKAELKNNQAVLGGVFSLLRNSSFAILGERKCEEREDVCS